MLLLRMSVIVGSMGFTKCRTRGDSLPLSLSLCDPLVFRGCFVGTKKWFFLTYLKIFGEDAGKMKCVVMDFSKKGQTKPRKTERRWRGSRVPFDLIHGSLEVDTHGRYYQYYGVHTKQLPCGVPDCTEYVSSHKVLRKVGMVGRKDRRRLATIVRLTVVSSFVQH